MGFGAISWGTQDPLKDLDEPLLDIREGSGETGPRLSLPAGIGPCGPQAPSCKGVTSSIPL